MNNNKQIIRLTESDLHRIIKESVNRVLREKKFDNPHKPLDNVNNLFKRERPEFLQRIKTGNNGRIEEALAQLLVDNGLTIADLQKYDAIMNLIDPSVLNDKIKQYQYCLRQEELYDRQKEYEAWAEEQMNDMGYDLNGEEL